MLPTSYFHIFIRSNIYIQQHITFYLKKKLTLHVHQQLKKPTSPHISLPIINATMRWNIKRYFFQVHLNFLIFNVTTDDTPTLA
jgi:hypothetical protein